MPRVLLAVFSGFLGTVGAFHLRAWSERRTMARFAATVRPSRRYTVAGGHPAGPFRREPLPRPLMPYNERRDRRPVRDRAAHPSIRAVDGAKHPAASWLVGFLSARWYGWVIPWEAFMDDTTVSTHDLVELLLDEQLSFMEWRCQVARRPETVEGLLQHAGMRAQTQPQE